MSKLTRYIRKASVMAVLSMASAYAYAVDCPGGSNFYHQSVGSVTPITTTINVAVASNFQGPAVDLADAYVAGTSYQVNLCHASSGTIASSIIGGNPYNIALFLAANYDFAETVYNDVGLGDLFGYAQGVPVFLLSPNAYISNTAADYFLTGQTNGAVAAGLTSNVVLKHASGTPAASTIAIANHVSAPYGTAASDILCLMGGATPPSCGTGYWDPTTPTTYTYNAGTAVTTACSSLVSASQWQCEYDNVGLTLQAIDNNSVTGGFVAWSQVCDSGSYPSARYVKFTNNTLDQYGTLVDIASSAEETVAADLVTYMSIGSGSWDTFLSNHCYQ
ncbi:MAG: substrate-binding domain-containing protein [Gammaproteobacteria bacterium]